MGAPIQMKVYNDRISLWNEGKLPEDFTIETLLGEHSSRPRNKNIANVFYRAGFIESWGRGIKKIRTGFSENGFDEPKLEESMGGILLTIFRTDTKQNLSELPRDSEICPENAEIAQRTTKNCPENQKIPKAARDTYLAIKDNPSATIAELSEKLNIAPRTVKNHIAILKEKFIRRVGSDTKGYWEIL